MKLNYKIGKFEFKINSKTIDFSYEQKLKFSLNIISSCHSKGALDISSKVDLDSIKQSKEKIKLVFNCISNIWKSKIIVFEIFENSIKYYFEIAGKTIFVDNINYFSYYEKLPLVDNYKITHLNDKKEINFSDYLNKNSVFFKKIFSSEINSYSRNYFKYYEYAQISANSDLDFQGGNFITSPSLLGFAFNTSKNQWAAFGFSADKGSYNFSEIEYLGGEKFFFNINYWGYETKNFFKSPIVTICFGEDEYTSLQRYVDITYNQTHKNRKSYDWWKKPIVCGWGHQCYMGDIFRTRSPKERRNDNAAYDSCTQHNYEYILKKFQECDIDWGTFIIDARWYISGGEKEIDLGKWPDMKGFVDYLHSINKKVLIWWSPWLSDGINEEFCIKYDSSEYKALYNKDGKFKKFGGLEDGAKICPDITLPEVQKILRRQINIFLGEDGYNFDGFKVDHLAAVPGIYGLKFGPKSKKYRGIELNKFYMNFLYQNSKKVKKDALVIGQSPNPYFYDCQDMVRLGDIYTSNISIEDEMTKRAKLSKIACPSLLIDSDGWPMPNLKIFEKYSIFSKKIGVPSLYYCSNIDHSQEQIPHQTFKNIQEAWLK